MYGYIDKLNEHWFRTLKNCKFYEKEGKTTSLNNEIGVLRGLYYAIEDLGIDLKDDKKTYKEFRYFINIQQKLKEGEKNV